MHCPRLDHFVRLNHDASVGKCGHMINAKGFGSYNELESSEWLNKIKDTMASGQWPAECVRCQNSERVKGQSIRTNSINRHRLLKQFRSDYLIVGGVLDNTCNSACQSCHSGLSTKIGSLESKQYRRIDNYEIFERLPKERIVELDVSGGEPTASRNYKKILKGLPSNVRIVRMNTNGSRMSDEIEQVLKEKIKVIVTMSLDGTGSVHDYTRWPIKWLDFDRTVDSYLDLRKKYGLLQLDFWTTVSCLNIGNLPDIKNYAEQKNIKHDWAFLERPHVLNVRYKNCFTNRSKSVVPGEVAIDVDNQQDLDAFMLKQDRLRNISVSDYFNFLPKR